MQITDSTITKTQKRNLTDMQEKFLDVLFGEAKGNPKHAAELAGYSAHSYPKVVRNLKKEILELAEIIYLLILLKQPHVLRTY